MQFPLVSSVLALSAAAVLSLSFAPVQSDPQKEMAEMMKKAAPYMQLGERHKVLEKLVGKWNTETTMFMGGKSMSGGTGTAEFSWLMPGRWLQGRNKGSMMGQPLEIFTLVGYDNFKMSYVTTVVSSIDTAMVRYEGDMTPDGKSLVSYGTLDEYLTGEHDKMVKAAWRFLDAETMMLEVHDLPIGEVDAKVFEIKYTRAK